MKPSILIKKIQEASTTVETSKNKNEVENAHLLGFIYKCKYKELTGKEYQEQN